MRNETPKTKFFAGCQNLNELKQLFRKLAIENHPDRGGDVETMKALNIEYAYMTRKLAASGTNEKTGFAYTETEINEEINLSEKYQAAVNAIAGLDGLVIELVGNWLWVTGNTRQHKEALKGAGFLWASQKLAWFFRTEEYKSKAHGQSQSLDDIKNKYGSTTVNAKGRAQLHR